MPDRLAVVTVGGAAMFGMSAGLLVGEGFGDVLSSPLDEALGVGQGVSFLPGWLESHFSRPLGIVAVDLRAQSRSRGDRIKLESVKIGWS